MQENLNRAHYGARRKLYNAKIKKVGNKTGVVLVTTEELNLYRDKRVFPQSMKIVECYLDIPGQETELYGNDGHGSEGINIYDVLPKYAYTSFDNILSEDDFIFRQIWLDKENFILQLFQVKKRLVKSKTFVQQQRFLIAPVNTLEGVRGDNQMQLAMTYLIEKFREEDLPVEGEEVPIPETSDDLIVTPIQEERHIVTSSWYNGE